MAYENIIFDKDIIKQIIQQLFSKTPNSASCELTWISIDEKANIDLIIEISKNSEIINIYDFANELQKNLFFKIINLTKIYRDILKINIKFICKQENIQYN
jgi:hypothetical protein